MTSEIDRMAEERRQKMLDRIARHNGDPVEDALPEEDPWTYETALAEGHRYMELARVIAERDDWKRFVMTSMNNTSRLEQANYYQTRALSFFQLAQLLR